MRNYLSLLILCVVLLGGEKCYSAQDVAFPAVAAGDPKSKTRIEIYLSPSCPMCAATFRNTVLPLLSMAAKGTDLYIFVGIMPSSNEDVKFARVLSCVSQQQLLPFMAEWYFYRREARLDFQRMLDIGKNYGMTANNEEQCVNERNDKALLDFNHFVFTDQKLKETPAVFINGKNFPNIYYLWQFEELLPLLNTVKK